MFRSLRSKLALWWASRQINREIAQEELSNAFKVPTIAIREAHETYRLGDAICTVMGNKRELEDRLALQSAGAAEKTSRKWEPYKGLIVDRLDDK